MLCIWIVHKIWRFQTTLRKNRRTLKRFELFFEYRRVIAEQGLHDEFHLLLKCTPRL